MPDLTEDIPPSTPLPVAPRKRGRAVLAWIIIVLIVGFEMAWPHFRPTPTRTGGERTSDIALRQQVRFSVGAANLLGQTEAMYHQLKKDLNTGPVSQRLCFLVVAGELQGPPEALAQCQALRQLMLEQGIQPTAELARVLDLLEHLYRDYQAGHLDGPALTENDRVFLQRELGWCGELALAPQDGPDPAGREALLDPARRAAITLIGFFLGGAGLSVVGLAGVVLWLVFLYTGQIRRSLPAPSGQGAKYAEAFAVYLVIYFVFGLGQGLLPLSRLDASSERLAVLLLTSSLMMLIALAAGLAWPVLRGIPWHQVRCEVGLTARRPLRESLIGLGGYVLVLPTFVMGSLITLSLLLLRRHMQLGDAPERHFLPIEFPSHPIGEWLSSSNGSLLLVLVVVLASILAPLVEETMFRGVFYRHLREATAHWGRFRSFLASAAIVSFLFAAVHPQGILAVPALMGVAFGLNLLREWRGSLLPSMMVHGIHNGLATFLLVQLLQR
jgi:membrane protease YdiL (CAAX protease family)